MLNVYKLLISCTVLFSIYIAIASYLYYIAIASYLLYYIAIASYLVSKFFQDDNIYQASKHNN